MNARQQQSMARLQKAKQNLPALISSRIVGDLPPLYAKSVAQLSDCVTKLERHCAEQFITRPAKGGDGEHIGILRHQLRRQYMIPLVRSTRRLLRFAPGAERALVTPHASAAHGDLIAAAERMLKFIRPHRKLLVESFGADFLARFRDTTKQLKRMVFSDTERQTRYERSSRGIREELARGNETLFILNGLLLPHMVRSKSVAQSWRQATRTPKRVGRPKRKRESPAREAVS